MFGLYFIIDMELSQSCRKEIKAGCKHLLYPDSRMVVIRFMACALWRSDIPSGRYSFCPVVYLYSHIVLQYRLLLGLLREKEKLSRTELHLAGTHIANYPDNDSKEVTSRGRTFYQTVVIWALYGAFYIQFFTAVYHCNSLYCSDWPVIAAVL